MEQEAGFKLERIVLSHKVINQQPKDYIGENFDFAFLADSMYHQKEQKIYIAINITIHESERKYALAHFSLAYIFKGQFLDTLIIETEDGRYQIPSELENYLKLTALNSTRGYIFSEVSGTYLHDAVLPIIDKNTFEENENKVNKVVNPLPTS